MLKKTITYTDFNGNEVSEDFYFHLSKADLVEMEVSYEGGLHEHLQKIVASNDGAAIIKEFKTLILAGYGKKSEDGKRFIKTQELRDEFQSTEAYSTLFMELCTDAAKGAEFVNGIVPAGLEKEMAKLSQPEKVDAVETQLTDLVRQHPSDTAAVPWMEKSRVLTTSEIVEMDADELKRGLATGRYKLSA